MRGLALVLAIATLLLQYRLWLSDDGWRELKRMRADVTAQRQHNEQLEERNQLLAAEVADLKKGMDALEERARSELGMIARNESFFQVVPKLVPAQAGDTEPPTRTARR